MRNEDGRLVVYCDADEEKRETEPKRPRWCPLRSHDIEFEGRVYFESS